MIKLIASDIDGTLIMGHQPISQRNRQAILNAIDRGVIFTIVSGRGIADILPVVEDIPSHIISGNGAEYYDDKAKLLLSCYMDNDTCIEISHIMQKAGLSHMIYTTSGTITPMNVETVRSTFIKRNIVTAGGDYDADYQQMMKDYKPFRDMLHVDDLESYLKDQDVIKIEGFEIGNQLINQVKSQLLNYANICVSSSFFNNIEVTDINATKGKILHQAIELLGIDSNEVLILGDGLNDMTLFEQFENTVAVDNAVDEIKQCAKYVVSSCEKDGVAEAIEKYVLFI
ncbi:MAG: Cof-type HAD-IIB family hydrolase [Erysipelotrichaceae bacterium]|nr:Cof-type HAD-IIB family hydrolase [Erysipelotrichaceae bacterium]